MTLRPSRTFTLVATLLFAPQVAAAITVRQPMPDFNGDGRTDIAWYNPVVVDSNGATTTKGGIWLMEGLSPNPSFLDFPSNFYTPFVAGYGDFDGDGKTDIVWYRESHALAMSLMDGSRATQWQPVGPGGYHFELEAAVDLDGDGKTDLVFSDEYNDSPTYSASYMDGAQARLHFSFIPPIGPSGAPSRPVAAGDFDGDGRSEIVFRGGQDALQICGFEGTALRCLGALQAPMAYANPVAIGDFNGDGRDDIVLQSAYGGAYVVWLMDGATVLESRTILDATSAYGWHIAAAIDLDGDGKTDLVWRHDDGSAGGWLMDGTTIRAYRGWLQPDTCWAPVTAGRFGGQAGILWGCLDYANGPSNGDYGAWLLQGLDITEVRSYGLAQSHWRAYP